MYLSGSEATEYGIALNNLATAGTLYVAWLVGSAGTGTILGKRSGATSTALAIAATDDYYYRPTSLKTINITTGAWSGGPTGLVAGAVLTVLRSSVRVGSVQVKVVNSSTDLDVAVQYGDVMNGDTLVTAVAETATVSAAPTALRTPSLTMRHNLDGLARDLVGARGNATLEGEAGGPLRWGFTFDGVQDTEADIDFTTGAGLMANLPPRLLGATFAVGIASANIQMPLRSFSVDLGNSVALRPDATASKGDHHAEITDRDPTITIGTDLTGATNVNWVGLRDGGTIIRVGLRVGSTSGNVMVVVGTHCQVEEISDEDSDGIAGQTITIKPRFLDDGTVVEEGDNELIFAQTSL